MQPGNMDAHHQMRLLFGQMDSPMMMPMQMPFLIPPATTAATATSSSSTTKTSEKEKDKDKAKTVDPVTSLPGYSIPGMSPYPYGMFPYTTGVPQMQMPLMLPLGTSPFMPYNLFPYPGLINPKDTETKSGTALLKELSNNSKKSQGGKGSPGPARSTPTKSTGHFDRATEVRARNSPQPKHGSDGKKFSDIVQSAIIEGFRETEKDKPREREKHTVSKSGDTPLDFTTKPRSSPVREPPRNPKDRPKHDDYLHLLQKSSLHHKQVKEREKSNTAKLKIEALIDFGQKKPTLSNLKLNLEKEMEEHMKASTFSAGSERYKFSPDTTYRGDERKAWFNEHKGHRDIDPREAYLKTGHSGKSDLSKKVTRDMRLYPGEIPKHFGDNLTLSSDRDTEDTDVLRGEAHQVRLARYNAQRLRMNSFYKSENYTYVEQVEPDSTGDLQDEPGEISPKKSERADQDRKAKASADIAKDATPSMTGPPPKRARVESPLVKPPHGSTLQDLRVDSSDVIPEGTDLSPPAKDNTVRDKILSYIKSRSKRKRDMSPIPTLIPDMPIQNLKLQPGLSIVDSWKHQLAPSIETTAQATLEEMVLQHWRQSLANDYSQASATKEPKEGKECGFGSHDSVTKRDKERFEEQLDLEPGEVYRPKLNLSTKKSSPRPKDSRTPSPYNQSSSSIGHDISAQSNPTSESCSPTPIITATDTPARITTTEAPVEKAAKKEIKRKADSPFSISDIMGDLGKTIPSETVEGYITPKDTEKQTESPVTESQLTDLSVEETPLTVPDTPLPLVDMPVSITDTGMLPITPIPIPVTISLPDEAISINDTSGIAENLAGSSSDIERDQVALSLSPKPYVSFSDSDRSDSSHKSKKHRRSDDANTVSAEFALEAVKALDCFAGLTSSAPTATGQNTSEAQGIAGKTEPETSSSAFGSTGHFDPKFSKKHSKKIKKRRKKLKGLSRKNALSKQMHPPPGDPDMSVLACTDISNVNLTKDMAFTGLFSENAKPSRPANGSVQHRDPTRPGKANSSGFSFGDKRRKPGRPAKVNGEQRKTKAKSCTNSAETVPGCTIPMEQPQRKKRSPLFYGCNYNDTLLISALRIKLPKSEKKLKKKPKGELSVKPRVEEVANTANNNKESNSQETVAVKENGESSDLLDNVALSTLRQTKECSVLLKDVSSYLTGENNMNVKQSPFSERTESEKENKDESSSSGAGSRCESPVRVFSRPQVAKRSKPWKTKQQLAGNKLVLRRDPSKNGYFIKYSDALREESEKLGPSEISSDAINNAVNSVVCAPPAPEAKTEDSTELPIVESQKDENIDEVFEESFPESIDTDCTKCELLDMEKKPTLVDRFKATLLNEVGGARRRGIAQRSRSTDDLTTIKSKKPKPKPLKTPVNLELDLLKSSTPSSPTAREERVSALKERLKLQQAAVAEIQWKMLESGAQSE